MLEAEWAFTGADPLLPGESRVEEVCKFVEGCLRGVVGGIAPGEGRVGEEISVLWKGGDEKKRKSVEDAFSARAPWTRISYTDAVKELERHHDSVSVFDKFRYEPKWGRPLQSEHERWLAETLVKGPVFIQDYPSALKPFYMRQNDDGATVACFDLVVPYMGELVGGSVREERAEVLEEKMGKGLGADLGEYKWYLDLRKYGGAPHVGFGMGFERLIGWVGGIENVRECVPMPRWAGRMLL
jgi:asparaginyl-tRNA synthetase